MCLINIAFPLGMSAKRRLTFKWPGLMFFSFSNNHVRSIKLEQIPYYNRHVFNLFYQYHVAIFMCIVHLAYFGLRLAS